MKKLALVLYVFFEIICSAVGFAVLVALTIALLSKDGCIAIDSPTFGKYEKATCVKTEQPSGQKE